MQPGDCISPQTAEILKQQKAKANDEYVLPSPNGGPISPDSVNNMLKRVLERAGFTLDTYAHVTTAAQKEAAQTIGNV